MDGTALARALVRRMAHDLASPLAALVTARGLGLPPLEGRSLEGAAIARLSDRLELWRLLAAPPDSAIDHGRLHALLAAEAEGRTPVTLAWSHEVPPALARAGAALLLCALNQPGAAPRALASTAGGLVLELADTPAARAFATGLAGPDPAEASGALAGLALACATPPAVETAPGCIRLVLARPATG